MRKAFLIFRTCLLIGSILMITGGLYEKHLDKTAEPGTARYERVQRGDNVMGDDEKYDPITLIFMIAALLTFAAPFVLIPLSLFNNIKQLLLRNQINNPLVSDEDKRALSQVFLDSLEQDIAALEKELEAQHKFFQNYRKIETLNEELEKKKAALERLRGTSSKTS